MKHLLITALAAVAALGSDACQRAPEEDSAHGPRTNTAAETGTPIEPPAAAEVIEVTDFDSALAAAAKADKIVVVDFYATWCGPCKKLDAETWPDEKVAGWLAENAVFLKVDSDKEIALAQRFRVTALPTIVFLDAKGEVLKTVVGFQAPRAFLKAAKAATKT